MGRNDDDIATNTQLLRSICNAANSETLMWRLCTQELQSCPHQMVHTWSREAVHGHAQGFWAERRRIEAVSTMTELSALNISIYNSLE